MKKISFLVLALLLFVSSLAGAQTGNKRWGLIIGIGKYPEAAGVENFNYVENDINGMETLFREKFSVPVENIIVLKDEQVTKDGVKKAIADMSGKISENDYVFIYIRARGVDTFPDFNNDEKSGYDTCIIPYDCQWKYPKTYISDDSLSLWLKDIKGKIIAFCDVNGGVDLIDLHSNKELQGRTLILGPSPGTEADEDSSQRGLMTNFLIEKTNELYEDYLDEIRSNSDEAQNLTMSIIIDEVKKKMNGFFEDRGRMGELSSDGKLDGKSIIILSK
jgi:hypothetical protein